MPYISNDKPEHVADIIIISSNQLMHILLKTH